MRKSYVVYIVYILTNKLRVILISDYIVVISFKFVYKFIYIILYYYNLEDSFDKNNMSVRQTQQNRQQLL